MSEGVADGRQVDRKRWDTAHDAAGAPTLRSIRAATVWRALPVGVEPTTVWPVWSLERLARELQLDAGEVFADVACGRGDLGVALAKNLHVRLIGVEPSGSGRRAARARTEEAGLTDASIVDGHFLDLGLDSNSVDGVLIADSLQLAPDRIGALREVARVLRPGRRLVVVGPRRAADDMTEFGAAELELETVEETPDWRSTVAELAEALMQHRVQLREELGHPVADALLSTPFDEFLASGWHGLVAARRSPTTS